MVLWDRCFDIGTYNMEFVVKGICHWDDSHKTHGSYKTGGDGKDGSSKVRSSPLAGVRKTRVSMVPAC